MKEFLTGNLQMEITRRLDILTAFIISVLFLAPGIISGQTGGICGSYAGTGGYGIRADGTDFFIADHGSCGNYTLGSNATIVHNGNSTVLSVDGCSPFFGLEFGYVSGSLMGPSVPLNGTVTISNTVCQYSNGGFVSSSPLPVELVNFTAKPMEHERAAMLEWSTASESNNRGFEVEQSSGRNGVFSWRKVGFVPGKGDASSFNAYSFMVKNLSAGNNYFRLRQVDLDGKAEYSPIVSLEMGLNVKFFTIFPNPALDGAVSLHFSGAPEEQGILEVFNSMGIKVYRKELLLEGEEELVLPLDLSTFSAGCYIATVTVGNKSFSEKLLIKN